MSQPGKSIWKRLFRSELFYGILLVGGYLVYQGIRDERNKNWTLERIRNKFSENLVVIRHDYTIKLQFQGDPEPFYITRDEYGRYGQWKKGDKPITTYGVGFITNKSGDCITSLRIANPLPEGGEDIELQREIKLLRDMTGIRSQGWLEIYTTRIGYYPGSVAISDTSDLFLCKKDGYFDGGIYSLKAVEPGEAPEVPISFTREQYKSTLDQMETLFIMGLPVDMKPGNKWETVTSETKVDSIVSRTKLDKFWDEVYFHLPSLYMIEGAPVFNRKGNIVGVVTMGKEGFKPGENGIKAFRTLLERK